MTQEQNLPVQQDDALKTRTLHEKIGAIFEGDEFGRRDFGTFNGVFRPTILTILGIMMYLRQGWMVGNAGLIGAILVIVGCFVITGATALSISCITTNIRVGSGGAFSIISQALGLEVGGSVGIPLYLAQGLSAALYMQGIIETWRYLFPEHPGFAVLAVVFLLSFLIAYFGARLAFRVQVGVMLLTIGALISMFMGLYKHGVNPDPLLWGEFEDGNFLLLFAVFFPAATGIMVGASMSGSLKNPRQSIPRGTLAAWGTALVVYLSLTVWYALIGTPSELRDTSSIFAVEKAFWGPMVLVGVMASCFSATLSSLVASPRVLQALAAHGITPFSQTLAKRQGGEPRNAMVVTGLIVLAALLLGDLDTIAQILTLFFLVIYFMVNLVLLIEQRLGLISFRPLFPIPHWVPLIGALACISAILIISPLGGLLAVTVALGIYLYLNYRHLETPWETVHSGIFTEIANWAARKVITEESGSFKRSWKPDLVVPVSDAGHLEGEYRLIHDLIFPRGSVQIAGFRNRCSNDHLRDLKNSFQKDGLFATYSMIEDVDLVAGMRTCLSVQSGLFFKPNTIYSSIDNRTEEELQALVDMSRDHNLGVILMGRHPQANLGRERTVNLWIRDQSPDWKLGIRLANLDYAVLMGYQLQQNWNASLRVLSVVSDATCAEMTDVFLKKLTEYARIRGNLSFHVEVGNFQDHLDKAPRADVHIFGLSEKVKKAFLEQMVEKTGGSCLFVRDSDNESALA